MRTPLLAGAAAIALLVPAVAALAETPIPTVSEIATELQRFEALGPVAPAQVLVVEISSPEDNAAFQSMLTTNASAIAAVRAVAGANSAIVTALKAEKLAAAEVVALTVAGDNVIVYVQPAGGLQMTEEEPCNDPLAEAALTAGSPEALNGYLAETPQGPCADLVLSALTLMGVEPAAGPTAAPPPGDRRPPLGPPGGGDFNDDRPPPPFIPAAEQEPENTGIPDPGDGGGGAPAGAPGGGAIFDGGFPGGNPFDPDTIF